MSPTTTAKNLLARSFRLSERILRSRSGWPAPENIRTVLILEYLLPLGCCVHLTPVYEAIKASRPDISIAVATRALGAAVLRHNPNVDHVIETPDPLTETFAAARTLRAALRKQNVTPDCVLTGASDQRTRIALLALLTEGARGSFTLAPQLYDRPSNTSGTTASSQTTSNSSPYSESNPATSSREFISPPRTSRPPGNSPTAQIPKTNHSQSSSRRTAEANAQAGTRIVLPR